MRSRMMLYGLVCLAATAWAKPASAQEIEIGVDYYTPEYYQDYPVYYDDAGQPYYYVSGTVNYVPRTYVRFGSLLDHYRQHRHNYRRWYKHRGHRYHGFRRVVATDGYEPLYYDGYVIYYTDDGIPFYYLGNRVVYIPHQHPRFSYYQDYYSRHRARYRTWYGRHGQRYRGYRRPHAAPAPQPVAAPPPTVYRRGPHRAPPHYAQPVPAPPAQHGPGRVDCRRFPNHPYCRRGEPRPAPVAAPHGPRRAPRPRGHRYH